MGSDLVSVARGPRGQARRSEKATATAQRLTVGAHHDRTELEADRATHVSQLLRQPPDTIGPDPASTGRVRRNEATVPVVVERDTDGSRIRRASGALAVREAPPPAFIDDLTEQVDRLPAGLISMVVKLLDAVQRGDLRITVQHAQPLLALLRALCDELAGAEEGPGVSADSAVMQKGMVSIGDAISSVVGADVHEFLDGEDFFVPELWLMTHVPTVWAMGANLSLESADDESGPDGIAALAGGSPLLALPGPEAETDENTEERSDGDKHDEQQPAAQAHRPAPSILPAVLVVGNQPDTPAQLPGEALAIHAINEIETHAKTQYGHLDPDLDALKIRALRSIRHKARSKVERVTEGGDAGNDAYFQNVVERFRAAVEVEIENAWVASMTNQVMARQALTRAKLDAPKAAIARAVEMYNKLYQPLAFAAPQIAQITNASVEQQLLDLHPLIPNVDWPTFLGAATASPSIMSFTIAHAASLAGVANTGAIIRCWHAGHTVLTSVVDCQTLLAVNLVNNNVDKALAVCPLLGTPQIVNLAALSTLATTGLFAQIDNLCAAARLGGDPAANQRMLNLTGTPSLKADEIKTFNITAGPTLAEATQCWTLLSANVTDNDKKLQIIRSLVKADTATRTKYLVLLNRYASLMDRAIIQVVDVVALVDAGLLVPKGRIYMSPEYGKGCIYVFNLAGQGRLRAEWHIHFQAAGGANKAKTVGAGWKNYEQRKTKGVKTFSTAKENSDLEVCLTKAGAWLGVII